MKRQWLGLKYALFVIGLIVLVLLVMDFNNRMAELRRLSDKKEEVAVEATGLIQTQVHLETRIALATSDDAVLEFAYEEGNLIREGDVLVVPLELPGATAVPTVIPLPTPTPESNWEIWLALFTEGR
jgi:cell division protein FtsB